MGKIFKTQKIWGYWFFDADGRRHQISLDTKEQDEAERWREILDASQEAGYDPMMLFYAEFGYIRDKYYEDLAKQIDPATIEVFKDYSSNLNIWSRWRIRWIDKMHVIFLLEKLQRERQKANDLRMTIKILNGIFEWAKKHGFVFSNPCDELNDETANQILDSISELRDQSIEAYGEVHSYWAYPPDETKLLLDKFGLSVEYFADMTDNKYDSIRRWFSNKKRMPEKLRKLVLSLVNPQNPTDAIVVSQPSAQFGKNMEFLRKAIGWLDRGEEYTKIELAEIFRSTHYTVAAWEYDELPALSRLEYLARFFSERFHTDITASDLVHRDIPSQFFAIIFPPIIAELPPEIKATTQEILRALLSNVSKIPKNKLGMLLNVVRMYTEAPPPAPKRGRPSYQ